MCVQMRVKNYSAVPRSSSSGVSSFFFFSFLFIACQKNVFADVLRDGRVTEDAIVEDTI